MTSLLLAVIYLAFIGLGLPDSLLGGSLAHDLPSVRGAGVQHGAHLYDHLRRDDPFHPEQQPPDPGTGRRQGDPAQHRTHRHRPAGFGMSAACGSSASGLSLTGWAPAVWMPRSTTM